MSIVDELNWLGTTPMTDQQVKELHDWKVQVEKLKEQTRRG